MLLPLASARVHAAATIGRDARHLRRAARDPGQCTVDDVQRLLRAHGVPDATVRVALDRLSALGVSAPIAWAYAMAYDGTVLADALADARPEASPDAGARDAGAGDQVRPDTDGARS